MTKTEMIDFIVETAVEAMDIDELIAYAKDMMAEDLAKQSKSTIKDQYEYMTN